MKKKYKFNFLKKNKKININNKFFILNNTCSDYIIGTSVTYLLKNSVIESGRKVITRIIKKEKKKNNANFFTVVKKFEIPLTSKGIYGRMGKGKGKIKERVALLNANSEMYHISNISETTLKKILCHLQIKMPVKLKILKKNG